MLGLSCLILKVYKFGEGMCNCWDGNCWYPSWHILSFPIV